MPIMGQFGAIERSILAFERQKLSPFFFERKLATQLSTIV